MISKLQPQSAPILLNIIPLSQFLQHSLPDIVAWICELSTFSESTNLAISSTPPAKSSRVLQVDNNPRYPYCEKHEPSNTYSMQGSSKQKEAKRVFALGDDDSHLDRNRTGNSEKAGSKAIVSRKERMIASKQDDTNTNFSDGKSPFPHLTI